MSWWMAALPIAMSLLKADEDKKQYKENMKMQAIKEKWSPWTGHHGQMQRQSSPVGTLMQGAMSGMAMKQNADDYAERSEMRKRYMDANYPEQKQMSLSGDAYAGSAVPSTSGNQGINQMPSGGGLNTGRPDDHSYWGSDYEMMMNQNPRARNFG